MSEPRIIPAIKGTRPRYSHMEAVELMEIILRSGHPRAEHLVTKLVTAAEQPGVYAAALARVQASLGLGSEEPAEAEKVDCGRCWGGELYDLLGHDGLGHRVSNALARAGARTLADLTSHGVGWLSERGFGAGGRARVRQRIGSRAWAAMLARDESATP